MAFEDVYIPCTMFNTHVEWVDTSKDGAKMSEESFDYPGRLTSHKKVEQMCRIKSREFDHITKISIVRRQYSVPLDIILENGILTKEQPMDEQGIRTIKKEED